MSDQQACERHKDCGLTEFDCLAADDRLRAIQRLWYVRVNRGEPFLCNAEDVVAMRLLLDGYDHPDTLPDPDPTPWEHWHGERYCDQKHDGPGQPGKNTGKRAGLAGRGHEVSPESPATSVQPVIPARKATP